jgi:hypothetical protein
MIDVNPAKRGVDNPSPRRREQRPFESWAELDAVAANLAPRYRLGPERRGAGLRPAASSRRRTVLGETRRPSFFSSPAIRG